MSIAAPTPVQAPMKHWALTVIELFDHVRVSSKVNKELFMGKLEELIRPIQKLAIVQFQFQEQEWNALLDNAFVAVSNESKENSISTLVSTELFKRLIATRSVSIDPDDHIYYRDEITVKMFQEMSRVANLDLSFIKDNFVAREWFCHVTETMQKPKERHLMHITMKQLPKEYYDKTLSLRSQIGRLICTNSICLEVRKLFKDETIPGLSARAREIYQKYLDELFKVTPDELKTVLRQNLIVSLGIRARQLT